MGREEIITEIASRQMIETMVKNIAHSQMTPDLKDLIQMTYLVLLEYDEKKIVDLWENNQISFFIARIIINQYRSSYSPYYMTIRKFQEMSTDITGMDWIDEGK